MNTNCFTNKSFGSLYLADNIKAEILQNNIPKELTQKMKKADGLKFFDIYVKENGETQVKDKLSLETTTFSQDNILTRLNEAMNYAIETEKIFRIFFK